MSSVSCHPDGIIYTILNYLGSAMWRLDSPLRSHRSCWSQYQHAYSGLNKGLFALAGLNLLQRDHQQSKTLVVAAGLHTEE